MKILKSVIVDALDRIQVQSYRRSQARLVDLSRIVTRHLILLLSQRDNRDYYHWLMGLVDYLLEARDYLNIKGGKFTKEDLAETLFTMGDQLDQIRATLFSLRRKYPTFIFIENNLLDQLLMVYPQLSDLILEPSANLSEWESRIDRIISSS